MRDLCATFGNLASEKDDGEGMLTKITHGRPVGSRRMRLLVLILAGLVIGTACVVLVGRISGNRTAQPDVLPPLLTPAEQNLLYQAEQTELGSCLRSKGFQYWTIPQGPPSAAELFPYGIDDVGWARQHGFGSDLVQADQKLAELDPNARYIDSLRTDPARLASLGTAENGDGATGQVTVALPTGGLLGHNTDGCVATAEASLYGDFASWFRASSVVDELTPIWQQDVLADSRYQVALGPWARCMNDKGQHVSTPAQAAAQFLDRGGPSDRDAEIKAATAEAECSIATGLSEVSHRLESSYETEVREEYRNQVGVYHAMALGALTRAREIVDASAVH